MSGIPDGQLSPIAAGVPQLLPPHVEPQTQSDGAHERRVLTAVAERCPKIESSPLAALGRGFK